jgi:hypothetical protein
VDDELWRRAEKEAKKQRTRRFAWCRLDHAMLDDLRWRLVARVAAAPLALVEAVIVRLETFASANRPRGSIEGFSIQALAAHWDVDDDVLARIWAALSRLDVGWLDQGYVVSFWDRNPDTEDTTAAERQRRFRARRKEAHAAMLTASQAPPKLSVRDLVPVNGPLVARRPAVPAQLCDDVTARLMGDPSPQRSALAEHASRGGGELPRGGISAASRARARER